MTRIDVSAEAVRDLGRLMTAQAEALALLAGPGRDAWAFGRGESAAAAEEVLGNWTHERLVLARALDALGRMTAQAGAAYVEVEAAVEGALGGGPTP